jgi:hypothetical protein
MKVTIERVANGWVVVTHPMYEEHGPETYAFGDDEDSQEPDAESLCRALWEIFNEHYQSKHQAGLVVEYKDCSREQEEDMEHEDRCCYVPSTGTRGSD